VRSNVGKSVAGGSIPALLHPFAAPRHPISPSNRACALLEKPRQLDLFICLIITAICYYLMAWLTGVTQYTEKLQVFWSIILFGTVNVMHMQETMQQSVAQLITAYFARPVFHFALLAFYVVPIQSIFIRGQHAKPTKRTEAKQLTQTERGAQLSKILFPYRELKLRRAGRPSRAILTRLKRYRDRSRIGRVLRQADISPVAFLAHAHKVVAIPGPLLKAHDIMACGEVISCRRQRFSGRVCLRFVVKGDSTSMELIETSNPPFRSRSSSSLDIACRGLANWPAST
jgi:hypothetical protein